MDLGFAYKIMRVNRNRYAASGPAEPPAAPATNIPPDTTDAPPEEAEGQPQAQQAPQDVDPQRQPSPSRPPRSVSGAALSWAPTLVEERPQAQGAAAAAAAPGAARPAAAAAGAAGSTGPAPAPPASTAAATAPEAPAASASVAAHPVPLHLIPRPLVPSARGVTIGPFAEAIAAATSRPNRRRPGADASALRLLNVSGGGGGASGPAVGGGARDRSPSPSPSPQPLPSSPSSPPLSPPLRSRQPINPHHHHQRQQPYPQQLQLQLQQQQQGAGAPVPSGASATAPTLAPGGPKRARRGAAQPPHPQPHPRRSQSQLLLPGVSSSGQKGGGIRQHQPAPPPPQQQHQHQHQHQQQRGSLSPRSAAVAAALSVTCLQPTSAPALSPHTAGLDSEASSGSGQQQQQQQKHRRQQQVSSSGGGAGPSSAAAAAGSRTPRISSTGYFAGGGGGGVRGSVAAGPHPHPHPHPSQVSPRGPQPAWQALSSAEERQTRSFSGEAGGSGGGAVDAEVEVDPSHSSTADGGHLAGYGGHHGGGGSGGAGAAGRDAGGVQLPSIPMLALGQNYVGYQGNVGASSRGRMQRQISSISMTSPRQGGSPTHVSSQQQQALIQSSGSWKQLAVPEDSAGLLWAIGGTEYGGTEYGDPDADAAELDRLEQWVAAAQCNPAVVEAAIEQRRALRRLAQLRARLLRGRVADRGCASPEPGGSSGPVIPSWATDLTVTGRRGSDSLLALASQVSRLPHIDYDQMRDPQYRMKLKARSKQGRLAVLNPVINDEIEDMPIRGRRRPWKPLHI